MEKQQKEKVIYTDTEITILNILQNLKPNERVSIETLSKLVHVPEREIQDNLRNLRINKKIRIASSKGSNPGTFLARNDKEWKEFVARRRREAITIWREVKIFEQM